MKKKINWFISILLALIFLIIWINIVDWSEFIKYFHDFNLRFVLFFSGFYILAYFFRSLRWNIILKPIVKLKINESFTIFIIGMLINYLIPVRAGEIAKSFILKTKKKIDISQSLPTVFIDKITDLFPILLILILIPLISVQMNLTLYIIIGIIFFIFILFIFFFHLASYYQNTAKKIITKFTTKLPEKFSFKVESFLYTFIDSLSIMKGRTSDTIKVYFLTLLAVLSESLYIFIVFQTFGANISYPRILFGYTLMNLTYILPTPPAQIGSNQFMWVLIFSFALGVNKNLTSAAVTFSHLLTSIWIFIVSAISFLALKLNFLEVVFQKKQNEE